MTFLRLFKQSARYQLRPSFQSVIQQLEEAVRRH